MRRKVAERGCLSQLPVPNAHVEECANEVDFRGKRWAIDPPDSEGLRDDGDDLVRSAKKPHFDPPTRTKTLEKVEGTGGEW